MFHKRIFLDHIHETEPVYFLFLLSPLVVILALVLLLPEEIILFLLELDFLLV